MEFRAASINREVKHTNVYVNVCLGFHAYYVIMTSSVLNSAKIYKLYNTRSQELVAYKKVSSSIIHVHESWYFL